ncbi:MAG: hypothetical protein ACYDAI_08475 [Trichloromonadaceae bacterium]
MGAIRHAVWFVLLILVAGCGGGGSSSSNSAAPRLNEAHEPGWRTLHDQAWAKDPVGCQVCHGVDYRGSGAVVSCFSCHASGPPFVLHPPSLAADLPWAHPVNHGSAARRDIAGCQGCHGQRGGAGSNVAFDVPLGNLEAGCQSTLGCHNNLNPPFASFENGHNPGAAHPVKVTDPNTQDLRHWYGETISYQSGGVVRDYAISHFDAGNVQGACTICHGASFQGGSGPACIVCHVKDPVANSKGCVSCHGGPSPGSYRAFAITSGRPELLPEHPLYNRRYDFYNEAGINGKHLQHQGIPLDQRDTQADCRVCHLEPAAPVAPDPNDPNFDQLQEEFQRAFDAFVTDPNRTNNRHHLFVGMIIGVGSVAPFPPFNTPGDSYSCRSCHMINIDLDTRNISIVAPSDCAECHSDLIAQ